MNSPIECISKCIHSTRVTRNDTMSDFFRRFFRKCGDETLDSDTPKTEKDSIVISDLVVRYGDFTAVDGISLTIPCEGIYGFLGPNGAGKTSTIRTIATLLKPSSGTISIDGSDVIRDTQEVRKRIGIVQQHISLDKEISVRENLVCHAMLHKVPKNEIDSRMKELCDVLGLDRYLDKLILDLSGGWRRRAAIACALMHRPSILFLDEPTAGLDTQSRHILWDILRELKKSGTTIFLTTHYMDEAESLCDRIAIIDSGRVIAEGTPKELNNLVGKVAVDYELDGRMTTQTFASRDMAKVFIDSNLSANDTYTLRKTSLEDVFLELTGNKIGDS